MKVIEKTVAVLYSLFSLVWVGIGISGIYAVMRNIIYLSENTPSALTIDNVFLCIWDCLLYGALIVLLVLSLYGTIQLYFRNTEIKHYPLSPVSAAIVVCLINSFDLDAASFYFVGILNDTSFGTVLYALLSARILYIATLLILLIYIKKISIKKTDTL